MRTRKQKEQDIKNMKKTMEENDGFIVFGFNEFNVNDINVFRSNIRENGGSFNVVKKRLLNLAFKEEGIDLEIGKFIGQTGFVSFKGDVSAIAGIIYKSLKKKEMAIFGGYDFNNDKVLDGKFISAIGQLPSREELLGRVVGAFAAPLRAFMFILKARSETNQ